MSSGNDLIVISADDVAWFEAAFRAWSNDDMAGVLAGLTAAVNHFAALAPASPAGGEGFMGGKYAPPYPNATTDPFNAIMPPLPIEPPAGDGIGWDRVPEGYVQSPVTGAIGRDPRAEAARVVVDYNYNGDPVYATTPAGAALISKEPQA